MLVSSGDSRPTFPNKVPATEYSPHEDFLNIGKTLAIGDWQKISKFTKFIPIFRLC